MIVWILNICDDLVSKSLSFLFVGNRSRTILHQRQDRICKRRKTVVSHLWIFTILK